MGVLRIQFVEFIWKFTGKWYVFDTYQIHVKALINLWNIIIWMEMDKSKVSVQFLLIFRQSGDVLFFLCTRRLRGYTATMPFKKMAVFFYHINILSSSVVVFFSNLKIFWFFLQKNLIKVKRTFSRNNIIWYAFYNKFATIWWQKNQIHYLDIVPGQLASKRKKTDRFEWMIFLPDYKYGRKVISYI